MRAMNAKSLLASLLVSVVVVAIYHVSVSGPAGDSELPRLDRRVDDLAAHVRALEERPPDDSTLTGRGSEPSGPTLEERVGLLEEQARRAVERAKPREAGSPHPLIQAAQEKARKQVREREMALRRREIRRLDANLADNDVNEAAALLSDHAQAVRDLYEGKEFVSEAERAALRQRFEELSRQLEADLSRYLSPELARRLSGGAATADSDDGR